MEIDELKLWNFRNLENVSLQCSEGVTVIVGANGQGKTNIVEAIHVLSSGKSFRTTDMQDLIRWNEVEASVIAKVKTDIPQELAEKSVTELGVLIRKNKKEAMLNGRPLKTFAEFMGRFVSVTFSPFDLALVRGAPQIRRSFLDRLILDNTPKLLSAYTQSARALKHKGALLSSGTASVAALEPWNQLIAESASKIVPARYEMVGTLADLAAGYLESFAPGDGRLGLRLATQFGEEQSRSAQAIFDRLMSESGREMRAQRCLIGPHRDDFQIELEGREAKSFASQGQVRSVVLSLKAGALLTLEASRGIRPVVVLDDYDSELDQIRTAALNRLIFDQKRQAFITTTEIPPGIKDLCHHILIWEVKAGSVQICSERSL